ncbi:hypothetical protein [Aestuariicoccus sp. MJ-SS9]|uniref:hypothetical protein n=1 Tax=Aestuariicoccus sp. MJ-SS9 TaxID=3079855 RepID=UPI0029080ED6|nr:hypothetical protein [Aestuariicoccus sp. MJ-SS9]MDU8913359.1 hypothetical protein [Aestuariicoccus sp. MJ-SS9]
MKSSLKFVGVICVFALSACATPPEKIKPNELSPLTYSKYSCSTLRLHAIRVDNSLNLASGRQRDAAKKDAFRTATAFFIFWPAAFLIDGGDDNKIATLKGQANALLEAAERKGCIG